MKIFEAMPTERPLTPLLDQVDSPAVLRQMDDATVRRLADELRAWLLYCVSQTGGHFGAGLGVIELTVALHRAFNTPHDRIIWDVGHQSYPHKILTGRREAMLSIRQQGGLAAFPKRSESDYDAFGVGHSSTSISAALGMALAARAKGEQRQVCAVIGDGALTAGMAFEALAHAGHEGANMLVVLNDNEMSISQNIGGLATYLSKILTSSPYATLRDHGRKVLSKLPGALDIARMTEGHVKGLLSPSTLFEEMGFTYTGPIDGHDLTTLHQVLTRLRSSKGPQFLHVVTRKGRGFLPAEQDPVGYHAITKLDPPKARPKVPRLKYCQVFSEWICDMAQEDARLMAITPAMKEGSDLVRFAQQYPLRYFDVAIAEQHAVTLAAGMACEGLKPVVAIYSTFLQRGYDQLIHDVAVQGLDVTFAVDRAGLVGEDGPTHHGALDISFLNCVPGVVIMAPSDEAECRRMLTTAYQFEGPAVVRYPRGVGPGVEVVHDFETLPLGQSRQLRTGKRIALLAFGSMVASAQAVAEALDASLLDMRFIKPLDRDAVLAAADQHELLVTLEENALIGGAGSSVAALLAEASQQVELLMLGLPDAFVDQGTSAELLHDCGLDAEGIEASIRQRLATMPNASL